MIAAALMLVALAAGALVLGVVVDSLGALYTSTALCAAGAVLLAAGVLRNRPSRRREPETPPWSGASGSVVADTPPDRPAEG